MSNLEWNVGNTADPYVQACERFVAKDSSFATFKQDRAYRVILEHVAKNHSDEFITQMKDLDTVTEEQIEAFKENDKYGTPTILNHNVFGAISPSTVRYIKNVLDIRAKFGTDIKDIVEIGGGYGGLCKTMDVLFDYENYVIIDLPAASKLTEKYLGKFRELDGRVQPMPFTELESIYGIDLLISNYAFSECSREIQMNYYKSVILNAENFYMIYNNITPDNIGSDEFIEMASKDFDLSFDPENTHPRNIIIYGTKKA